MQGDLSRLAVGDVVLARQDPTFLPTAPLDELDQLLSVRGVGKVVLVVLDGAEIVAQNQVGVPLGRIHEASYFFTIPGTGLHRSLSIRKTTGSVAGKGINCCSL